MSGSGSGLCHARGVNTDLPAQWLVDIVVADLDASLAECVARGGAVVAGPKMMALGPALVTPSYGIPRSRSRVCTSRLS